MTRVDGLSACPARLAWLHTVVGLALVAIFQFGPESLQTPVMALVLVLGMVALHVGPRRNLAPADRTPWRLIRAGGYLFIVASLIRAAVPSTVATPPTWIAFIPNSFVVPAYLCIGYAFSVMLRRRRAADDDPARIDAILVGLAFAFLTWTFVIAPSLVTAGVTSYQILDALFPIIDVVLLVLVAQLLLAGGAQKPALWLLTAAAGAMFAGDLLYSLRDAQVVDISQATVNALFLVMFVLIPASALHPSTGSLVEPQQIVVSDMSRLRLVVIGLVVVVPTIVTSLVPVGIIANDLIRAALCALLVLGTLARVVRSNNSRVRAERATRRRATHDALTDLPNRELLSETVSRWADRATDEHLEISLLFIDLDRFKMINDHWGHQVGDELLCAVAARLAEQVRAEDVVARIGGDEFVIALASPSHLRLAESLADRLLIELAHPFELSVGDVAISASIGVAKSTGGAHALELIRDADTAMYKAKGSGRNAYAMFDTTLREQVRDRVKLEQALRGALERGELAVHFQPIVDLASEELDGFEALMRWNSPELGFVSPIEFIPIAEETGMIEEMGAWLLRESARQLLTWTDTRGPGARPLHVSVNVAVRQLRDGTLVRIVDDVLRETGLPPNALWLEITESGVMEDIEAALLTLNALHALGVTLCIDDFGTGYSSLSYLHRLPVGIVKIDRSFISDIGLTGANEPIVRAVLAMTHAMGHRVVAEGVETETQRDWLRDQGCDLVQGWFYGKAERPANLKHWIERTVPA
ncbi:putative bifunctional diguanylate cyclase/phosphodiesterase [Paractinoplanes globisporus]|uniref:Bifunctional diguanylate cyclase/phosphodiesterase n=1 Tax=Paractinoplanes globisporus TaxID=113565 RepID=A0ABW6WLT9_9ACTN|nr:EAL domain-containing protein [Actinoplanes globisporus]